jgi:hypothetical protein
MSAFAKGLLIAAGSLLGFALVSYLTMALLTGRWW